MTNAVRIDIEVTENARKATEAGERIRKPMVDAAGDIDRAFDKTSRQLSNSLDKIERDAWKSGKGMDDAFGTAMGGLRKSLELAREEARQTGAGLHTSVGGSLREIQQSAEKLADSLKPIAQATVPINTAWEKTSRLIAIELDRVERDAWDAGKGTDKAFQTALASVRADFERVRDVGRRTGASLESELGGSLREIKKDMERLGAEARETGQEIRRELDNAAEQGGASFGDIFGEQLSGGFDMSGLLEGLTGGSGGGLVAAAGAAGTAIAAAEFAAFQRYFETREIFGLIAAQQGGGAAEATKIGMAVGDAYADGFGESIEGVAEAANAALSAGLVSMDAPKEAIEDITEMAATAAQITGASADEVARTIRVLLKTGMAGDAQEAFDLVVAGFQRGANAGGDLLDVLTRSSVNLKQFGLDGTTSVGVLIQTLEAGAPSADAFTGALEELVGNASDGIPIFEQLGLGGQEFASALVGGGPKAAKALDQLLDKLRQIEDPAERSRIMVGLFGEEATAMQDAILAVDPSSATSKMKDFAGATKDAAETIQAAESPLDKFGRQLETGIGGALMIVTGDTDTTTRSVGKLNDGVSQFSDEADNAADAAGGYAQSLQEVVEAGEELANQVLALSDAEMGYQAALDDSRAALEENGVGLDIASEKGRDNKKALDDIADSTWNVITAMKDQNATTEEVRSFMEGARSSFVQMAIDMGMTAAEANALADKLGLIPGNYVANVQLTGYEQAYARAEALENKIRSIPSNKQINLRVSTSGSGHMFAGLETGGNVGMGIWAAQSGGQRHSSTLMNEAGPEIVELPTGSRVATAGATRALAESGAFGGGGGPVQLMVSWAGAPDAIRGILEGLRFEIANSYGGSATAALGQRGA